MSWNLISRRNFWTGQRCLKFCSTPMPQSNFIFHFIQSCGVSSSASAEMVEGFPGKVRWAPGRSPAKPLAQKIGPGQKVGCQRLGNPLGQIVKKRRPKKTVQIDPKGTACGKSRNRTNGGNREITRNSVDSY